MTQAKKPWKTLAPLPIRPDLQGLGSLARRSVPWEARMESILRERRKRQTMHHLFNAKLVVVRHDVCMAPYSYLSQTDDITARSSPTLIGTIEAVKQHGRELTSSSVALLAAFITQRLGDGQVEYWNRVIGWSLNTANSTFLASISWQPQYEIAGRVASILPRKSYNLTDFVRGADYNTPHPPLRA